MDLTDLPVFVSPTVACLYSAYTSRTSESGGFFVNALALFAAT